MPTPKTTYAVRRRFPNETPTVVILLKGLLTFCFGGNLSCEVGLNNQSPVGQEHKLKIELWRKTPACPPVPEVITDVSPRIDIDIDVQSPEVLDGVYVYEPTPLTPFVRLPASDERDFRWVLDLEGPDLYNVHLPKVRAHVRPSININNGLFYTRQKTQSQFVLFSSAGSTLIGSVASLVAVNIYLAPGGQVDLTIDRGTSVPLRPAAPDHTFQVDISYDCVAHHCGYLPGNPTKETRNDFYLNHRAFTLPGSLDEKQLICTFEQQGNPDLSLCRRATTFTDTSDPAPCMGTTFGQSSSHD